MKKVFVSITVGFMMLVSFFGFIEAAEVNRTQNNILKAGAIVAIEYSESPDDENILERRDSMYIAVDEYVYLYKDFVEDMAVGDDVLVIMNTKGTSDAADDIIRGWMYWRPDIEPTYIDEIEQGACVKDFDIQKLQSDVNNIGRGLQRLSKKH